MDATEQLHEAAERFADLHERVLRDEATKGAADEAIKAERRGSWFTLLDACLAFARRAGRGGATTDPKIRKGSNGASRYRLLVEVPDDPKLPATARLKAALKLILRSAQVRCLSIVPDDADSREAVA